MTKEKALKLSELYKALAEGKLIEMKMGDEENDWQVIDRYDSLPIYNYKQLRVQPEPKYRPYTPEEVLLIIEKSLRETKDYPIFINTSDNKEFRVVGVNNNCIIARDEDLEYAYIKLSNILTLWYAWKDGSPCGVEVAE